MPKTKVHRRNFLKTGITGLAGLLALPKTIKGQSHDEERSPETKVIIRTLGKTGIRLPVVSMGVMNSDNPNLVKAALDAGIRMLDTAHGYQRGRNEEMIGQVLKGRKRDSFVIATKAPGFPMDRDSGLFTPQTSGEAFLEKVDISLQRLGLEYVDILYLHNVWKREAVLFEPLMRALEKAKKSGKARFIGVTSHQNQAEVIQAVIDSKLYDVVLTGLNFRDDHHPAIRKAIAKAAAAGVGVVAMKTQAGVYWDKEKMLPINMRAALKWVLQDPNVTTAIPGFTTFEQIQDDLPVMSDVTLNEKEKADLLGPGQKVAGFYCQHCNRCLPQCPGNLPIPALMRGYMYAHAYKNFSAAQDLVASLQLPSTACQNCQTCPVRCSKGFDVAARIKNIIRIQDVPADWFA